MLSTTSSGAETPVAAGLSQLVHDRKMFDERLVSLDGCDLTYVYYTTNSSCSDVTSPITPTFSARSHLRYSSSSSSLELPLLPLDGPASPAVINTKTSLRQLPDVQEERDGDDADEYELDEEDEDEVIEHDDHDHDDGSVNDNFGLYSCLCDQACEHHRGSSEFILNGDMVNELAIEYDLGFLSDNDLNVDDSRKKKRAASDAFVSITSRLGVKIPGISRWRSLRQTTVVSSPTTERSLENVLAGEVISSRSSSLSSPCRQFPVVPLSGSYKSSTLPMPSNASEESLAGDAELVQEEPSSIERDRSMALTPLLPPMMTDPLGKPPQKSPLQSPTIASSPPAFETSPPPMASPRFQRTSLSAVPSRSSLQQVPGLVDLPFPLPPSILQEQDEWADRLGHANFTIIPEPYELDMINAETVTKFRDDWDAARVNYTKHLVRTGDNYGHTSKIYALTEAKWAETERKWKSTYDKIIRQTETISSIVLTSRSRSRGRGRGRAEATFGAGTRGYFSNDDVLSAVQWRRMEECLPSAVPQMLEALDADGKFPGRGDEDIVGPMQRDAYMVRARSEETKAPRFWKSWTEKLRR